MLARVTYSQLIPFGVEVSVDPKRGLGSADKEDLRQLFALDGLIVVRNLHLSMDEQLDLCETFGPVMRGSRENYIVSNVHRDGLLGDRELLFHHDITFVPAPYLGGSLHALDVSEGVSGTRFANGFRAYERLPSALRERIDRLNALHVRERAVGRRTRLTDSLPTDNCAVHAVVGRQQGTGRPYLFVNTSHTACIIGMSEVESDRLLDELFSYLYADADVYEHAWKNGDIVIWDNLAVQHARKAVAGGTRTLQRVTIAKLGYWDQCPVDLPSYQEIHTFKEEPA
jgi:taurine dioxygenase